MAVQLLPIGSGQAISDEFTIPNGEAWTLVLNNDQGGMVRYSALVRIEVKDPVGNFFEVAELRGDMTHEGRWLALEAPGTYRIVRYGQVPCGVFALR